MLDTKVSSSDVSARCWKVTTADGTTSHHMMGNSTISLPLGEAEQEEMIVAWEEDDLENPYNWSGRKKASILLTTMMLIINSTMGSALPSNALPFIASEWGVSSQPQRVLPISIYMAGYVMGK
jgi:hypothetical protein